MKNGDTILLSVEDNSYIDKASGKTREKYTLHCIQLIDGRLCAVPVSLRFYPGDEAVESVGSFVEFKTTYSTQWNRFEIVGVKVLNPSGFKVEFESD